MSALQATTVRCQDCGFLAIRGIDTGQLYEARQHYRDTGHHQRVPGGDSACNQYPRCYFNIVDYEQESMSLGKQNLGVRGEDLTVLMLRQERECKSFMRWVPEHSPKEHLELRRFQEMSEWQRGVEDRTRQWGRELADRDRTWRTEDREDAANERKEAQERERLKLWGVAAWTLFTTLITWWIAIVALRQGK